MNRSIIVMVLVCFLLSAAALAASEGRQVNREENRARIVSSDSKDDQESKTAPSTEDAQPQEAQHHVSHEH